MRSRGTSALYTKSEHTPIRVIFERVMFDCATRVRIEGEEQRRVVYQVRSDVIDEYNVWEGRIR